MATEEQVKESLETTLVPAVKRSIVRMSLVREVTISDKKVNVTLVSSLVAIVLNRIGYMVTEMAKGRSVGEAQRTTQREVLDALGELPPESEHCALLAANTLKAAIRDYMAMKQEPWEIAYRNY